MNVLLYEKNYNTRSESVAPFALQSLMNIVLVCLFSYIARICLEVNNIRVTGRHVAKVVVVRLAAAETFR